MIKIELDFSLHYIMLNLPQPGAQLTPTMGQVGHFDKHFLKVYCDQSIYIFYQICMLMLCKNINGASVAFCTSKLKLNLIK